MNFVHVFTSDGLLVALPIGMATKLVAFLREDGGHPAHLWLQAPGSYVVGR